jgi:hypothetical protein
MISSFNVLAKLKKNVKYGIIKTQWDKKCKIVQQHTKTHTHTEIYIYIYIYICMYKVRGYIYSPSLYMVILQEQTY